MSEINYTKEIPEVTYPINLKIIKQYQRKYPILRDKYKECTYQTGSFCGGKNIYSNLKMCKENIVIPSILQNCVLHWYHMYLLHLGMDRTEAKNFKTLYWPITINAVRKEVTNCNTFQLTKRSNIKYGKLPAEESGEILWNKLFVDIIGLGVIWREGYK